jgi:hypothetical protein
MPCNESIRVVPHARLTAPDRTRPTHGMGHAGTARGTTDASPAFAYLRNLFSAPLYTGPKAIMRLGIAVFSGSA